MGFVGPADPGMGLSGGGSAYDQFDPIIQRLLQQFPGLANLAQSSPATTSGIGYSYPGTNLFSGQAASGGGLFGSTGTGIFEGASQGQPESVTGGLSAGYLGKPPHKRLCRIPGSRHWVVEAAADLQKLWPRPSEGPGRS